MSGEAGKGQKHFRDSGECRFPAGQSRLPTSARHARLGQPAASGLLAVLCIVTLFVAVAGAQSAWTRSKHSGFIRLGLSSLNTSSFYTPLGNKLKSAKYSDVTASHPPAPEISTGRCRTA